MKNEKTRIDPRVLRTRQLIKDAVIELLEEMDIEKISVNRIAERAQINRVTFYLHYQDLQDMLEKMADEMVADILEAVSIYEEKLEHVKSEGWVILEALLIYIADNARFYKIVLNSRRSPIFTDRLFLLVGEMISEYQNKKVDSANISEDHIQNDIAIWYSTAALIGTIITWLKNDMPYTPTYLAKQITMLRRK